LLLEDQMIATAVAHTNIALVKYWGKRNPRLNLPAVGSISITLQDLFTRTSVFFKSTLNSDELFLDGKRADPAKERRVSDFLDIVRKIVGIKKFAEIRSQNNFPTGAGLASSASGFAALTIAATGALDLKLSRKELSILARQGSGSAARSLYGGFVEMIRGERKDGSDAHAIQLADENNWPLSLIIVITSESEKSIGSTDGMKICKETSPYYKSWIDSSEHYLAQMKQAIADRNFRKLGNVSENSCLKMHALMISSTPPLFYWNETTLSVIKYVYKTRENGIPAYFTIDAGPQVKIICHPEDVSLLESELKSIPGVKKTFSTSLGPSAQLIREKHV
jgi:diphosphomevalonate decarboxylase